MVDTHWKQSLMFRLRIIELLLFAAGTVLICELAWSDTTVKPVVAHFESGNVNYMCTEYNPPIRIDPFPDGSNHQDSTTNLLRSQYTQMVEGDWEEFSSLWGDWNASFQPMDVKPSPPSFYTSAWHRVLNGTEQYLRYKVEMGPYTIMVVDVVGADGNLVARGSSTMKRVKDRFEMTRELTAMSHPFEWAVDDPRFDPMLGEYITVTISGNILYSGLEKGAVRAAVVFAVSPEAWDGRFENEENTPGAFVIPDVIASHEYVAKAFMDVDGDGAYSDGEPLGYYSENPIYPTQDISGITIVMEDAKTESETIDLATVASATKVEKPASEAAADVVTTDPQKDAVTPDSPPVAAPARNHRVVIISILVGMGLLALLGVLIYRSRR